MSAISLSDTKGFALFGTCDLGLPCLRTSEPLMPCFLPTDLNKFLNPTPPPKINSSLLGLNIVASPPLAMLRVAFTLVSSNTRSSGSIFKILLASSTVKLCFFAKSIVSLIFCGPKSVFVKKSTESSPYTTTF